MGLPHTASKLHELIKQQGENGGVMELPYPPDHIIVLIKPNKYVKCPMN